MPAVPNAIKVSISGGSDVYFTAEEIIAAVTRDEEVYQINRLQEVYPEVACFDNETTDLAITFEIRSIETETKINSILDAGAELEIFFALLFDTDLSAKVIPLLDGIISIDTFGELGYSETLTVKFIKSGN